MNDMFDDAMDEDMAHSQDAESTAVGSLMQTDVISIDDDDVDDVDNAMMHTPPAKTQSENAAPSVKRSNAAQLQQSCSKRRAVATESKPPKLVEIHTTTTIDWQSEGIQCVFVASMNKKKKIIHAVPLFPLYQVQWKSIDHQQSKWIYFGNYERWVTHLVDAITDKNCRMIAKSLCDTVRIEFAAALGLARIPKKLEDPFADSDSPPAQELFRKHRSSKATITPDAIDIHIGGCKLNCVNNSTKMILKVDDDTVKFILKWVVPFVRELALKEDEKAHSQDKDVAICSKPPTAPAAFHFNASATPPIRDKVTWDVVGSKWLVTVKKPKVKNSQLSWPVDTQLCAIAFEKEKLEHYHRAIDIWNDVDGSTRRRIAKQFFPPQPNEVASCTPGEPLQPNEVASITPVET